MPAVVPLSQLQRSIAQAVASTVNALVALKKAGLSPEMPDAIQISIPVSLDTGINAIERTASQGGSTSRTVSTKGEEKSTSIRGPVSSQSVTEQSGQSSTENSEQRTTSSDSGRTALGRRTETKMTYES